MRFMYLLELQGRCRVDVGDEGSKDGERKDGRELVACIQTQTSFD